MTSRGALPENLLTISKYIRSHSTTEDNEALSKLLKKLDSIGKGSHADENPDFMDQSSIIKGGEEEEDLEEEEIRDSKQMTGMLKECLD